METEDYGDYQYDLVPTGYGDWGDYAFDVVPSPDEFGLGYGDFGRAKPTRKGLRKRLKKMRSRRRSLKLRLRTPFLSGNKRKRIQKRLKRINMRIKRIMKRLGRRRVGRGTRRQYRPIRPRVQQFRPIRPRVANYQQIRGPGVQFAPIQPPTQSFSPIIPFVQSYAQAPMDAGSQAPVRMGIRTMVGAQQPAQAEYEDYEDEDYDDEDGYDADSSEDAEEDMDGYGSWGKWMPGVVATPKRYKKLRKEYLAMKGLGAPGAKKTAAKLKARLKKIEKKNAMQIARRKKRGKAPKDYQRRLRRLIKTYSPFRSAASKKAARSGTKTFESIATITGPKGKSLGYYLKKYKAMGWKRPPTAFLRGKRTRFRWRMWNLRTSKANRLRRTYWAKFRRRGGGRRFQPRYMPIPRPAPQYRPINPYMSQYRPIRTPGPMFAPIQPPMAQYVPAPMPQMRQYAPVTGLETRNAYTYTTAQASQSALAAQQNAEVATEQAFESDTDQDEGNNLLKIGLGIAVVGGGIYFLSKNKKKGSKPGTGTTRQ